MIETGDAELARLEGLPWWREWLLRKCVRRSGDAQALDSGLLALALRDEVTLQDVDEASAAVAAASEDAGLWILAERSGALGPSRFDPR